MSFYFPCLFSHSFIIIFFGNQFFFASITKLVQFQNDALSFLKQGIRKVNLIHFNKEKTHHKCVHIIYIYLGSTEVY